MTLVRSRISTMIRKATLLATALSKKLVFVLATSVQVTDGGEEVVRVLYIYYLVQF